MPRWRQWQCSPKWLEGQVDSDASWSIAASKIRWIVILAFYVAAMIKSSRVLIWYYRWWRASLGDVNPVVVMVQYRESIVERKSFFGVKISRNGCLCNNWPYKIFAHWPHLLTLAGDRVSRQTMLTFQHLLVAHPGLNIWQRSQQAFLWLCMKTWRSLCGSVIFWWHSSRHWWHGSCVRFFTRRGW